MFFVKPKINPPLVPPAVGWTLLVFSTFALAVLPAAVALVALVVLVVLPPPLVQLVRLSPSRKLLQEVFCILWQLKCANQL